MGILQNSVCLGLEALAFSSQLAKQDQEVVSMMRSSADNMKV
jgi:hypothetical protein